MDAAAGSVVDLDHTVIAHARVGLWSQSSTVSVDDSSFVGSAWSAVRVSGDALANLSAIIGEGNQATGSGDVNGIEAYGGVLGSATITTNDTWQFVFNAYGTAQVAEGTTLTLAPGAVVKFERAQLAVQAGGTLQSQGTSASPVSLSSAFDDTVGGRVNGLDYVDGRPEGPSPGDWPGVDAAAGSVVDLDHTVIAHARVGLWSQSSTVSVDDSSFVGSAWSAVRVSGDALANLSAIIGEGNQATGSGDVNGIEAYGGVLGSATITTNDTWQFVFNAYGTAQVAEGTTLTLAPGAVVKFERAQLAVQAGGTLQSQGTSASPVSLSSAFDDTVGGRVNGLDYVDGRPEGPSPGDWPGVDAAAGSVVDLDHTVIAHARVGLWSQSSTVSVDDSSFVGSAWSAVRVSGDALANLSAIIGEGNQATGSGDVNGIEAYGGVLGSATITTNDTWQFVFNAYGTAQVAEGTTLTLAPGAVVKFERAQLAVQAGGTLQSQGTSASPVSLSSAFDDTVGGRVNGLDYVDGRPEGPSPGDWPGVDAAAGSVVDLDHTVIAHARVGLWSQSSTVSVDDSSFVGSAWSAVRVSGDALANLSAIIGEGNQATGSGDVNGIEAYGGVLGSATITTNDTWQFVFNAYGTAQVAEGTTLTLAPGAVVKFERAQLAVQAGGTLQSQGTSASPVSLSSAFDDTVGGRVNGLDYVDGRPEGPSPGDWPGIDVAAGGNVDATSLRLRYASTALSASGGVVRLEATDIAHANLAISASGDAAVSVRGSFRNVSYGVRACNWEAACAVDAAHVDWGSGGPFSAGAHACGAVAVDPWVGQGSEPTTPFLSANCDGSGTPSERVFASAQRGAEYVTDSQIDCSNGFEDACEAINRYNRCVAAAVSVAQIQYPDISGETAAEAGQSLLLGTLDALRDQLSSAVGSLVRVVANTAKIVGVVSTVLTLSSAYDGCIGA